MRNNTIDSIIYCFDNRLSILSFFTKEKVEELISIDDSEIRSWIARALAIDSKSDIAFYFLRKLAADNCNSVRVEAIDSLSEFVSSESFDTLSSALYDPDCLVRAYAAFGVAYVGRTVCQVKAKELLLSILFTEADSHVLVSIYEGLYILGDTVYLENLFDLFHIDDYQIQCAVLNSLTEILNCDNIMLIRAFLQTVAHQPFPKSVTFLIEELAHKTGDA